MHLFFSQKIEGNFIYLDEEESHHCNHVLRLKQDSILGVLDGLGTLYECRLVEPAKKDTRLEILSKNFTGREAYSIHITMSPTKNMERTEWFVEKAVELGISTISFIRCVRSERKEINILRLTKKAIGAIKQSQNRYLPLLNPIRDFRKFAESVKSLPDKFIACLTQPASKELSEAALPGKDYVLLIGPEGDFDDSEVEWAVSNNFTPVSLGKLRLRTETAGLVGLHTLIVLNQIKH